MEKRNVYIGTENGKKIYKSVYAANKKELEQKVSALKNEYQKGKDVYTKATFAVWSEKWFKEIEEPKGVSKKTLDEIRFTIGRLNEEFGNMEFKKIKLSMFQTYLNELAKCNPTTGKPASKRTLKLVKDVAENVFGYASANDIAGVPSFFKYAVIPNAPEEKRRALTIEEQQMIIDTPHKAQLPAMILLFSGLRRGELIPLEWGDIDLSKGIIRVNKSAEYEANTAIIKQGGKTENATRLVPIPPILVDYLTEYKKETKVLNKLVLGKLHTLTTWKTMWSSYLTDLNVKYGYGGKVSKFSPKQLPMRIEKFSAHYLRHTYATMLFLQGINSAYAMQFLGHANVQTTINVYTDIEHQSKLGIPDEYKRRLNEEYKINFA